MVDNVAIDGKVNVRARECGNCLLGKDRLVSGDRARQIIRDTRAKDGATFICHKGQISDEPTAICRGWWDRFADEDCYLRLVKHLDLVREVGDD